MQSTSARLRGVMAMVARRALTVALAAAATATSFGVAVKEAKQVLGALPTAWPLKPPQAPAAAVPSSVGQGGFTITLVPGGLEPISPKVVTSLEAAAATIASTVVADVPDVPSLDELWDLRDPASVEDLCSNIKFVVAGTITPEECEGMVAEGDPSFVQWLVTGATVAAGGFEPYTAPVDDLVVGYRMARPGELRGGTLAVASWILRRPASLDPYRRPISALVIISEAAYLNYTPVQSSLLLAHELLHTLGLGTNWPTPAGCGNMEACRVLAGSGSPLPYDQGATGECLASQEFARACAADARCSRDYPDGQLLVETNQPTMVDEKGVVQDGSNCVHWSDTQLPGEIMSSAAQAFAQPGGVPTLHITRVTLSALVDLGYEVDMDTADDFSTIYALTRGLSTQQGPQHARWAML